MNSTEEKESETPGGFYFTMYLTLTICALGFIGNILCAIVLLRRHMRSSYTYLLIGLTFSDLMLITISAVRTYGNLAGWNLGTPHALAVSIFLWDWICTGGTKYFTVAVSLERFVAICYPIYAHRYVTERNSKFFAIGTEALVILIAVFSYVYVFHIKSSSFDIYAAIVLHFSPFLAVLLLNIQIYFGLVRFRERRKSLTEVESAEAISVTKMLLTVVFVFGFCYSFEFTRRVLTYAGYFDFQKYQYYDYTINQVSDIFYVLNSSVNFIIYCLLGRKFRTEFIKILKNICCKSSGSSTTTSWDTSNSSNSRVNQIHSSKESNLDSI